MKILAGNGLFFGRLVKKSAGFFHKSNRGCSKTNRKGRVEGEGSLRCPAGRPPGTGSFGRYRNLYGKAGSAG
jgi:hypothetical protein